MQGAKDDVAGFRGGEGELNGFKIAHFANQDNIGVLAQCRAQSVGKRVSVRAQLALVDQTLLRCVDELDRDLRP